MSKLKLVTFDVTNTIIKVAGGVGYQYATIGKLYGVQSDEEKLNKAFKVKWKEQNNEFPNYGVTKGMSAFSWWSDLVKKCFIHTGINNEQKLTQIAGHLYVHFKTAKAWEVLPGSDHVLQSLKQKGLILGVISNFDDRLEKILMSLALRHHFNFVLPSHVVKVEKPDIQIFERALKHGGVEAENVLHVGDNVLNDYFGARNAGMQSVLFLKDIENIPDGVDENFVVSSLSELLKYV